MSVLTESELIDAIARDRAAGRTIAFANGCFDLLHVGHIQLLKSARALGDRLVVAVDSDEGVRALKGAGRPMQPQGDRADILAALDCVDWVVLFGPGDLHALIAAIRPEVLVKGADYAEREIVGRDVVEAGGGEVVLVPLSGGRSTSLILERARGGFPAAAADAG